MSIINCPNCSVQVEIEPDFLGRQVGCVGCRCVYILSQQYNDEKQKRFLVISTVLITLIVVSVIAKVESDYSFVRKSYKAISKAVKDKHEELFGEEEVSESLSFFDFDSAYGNLDAKLKRTSPIVLPQHKDRVVEWAGEIARIIAVKGHPYGNFYVKFKQSDAAISDVTVYFRDDQIESLGKLHTGHYVKFQGVIVSAGYGNTDHILRRGKILE